MDIETETSHGVPSQIFASKNDESGSTITRAAHTGVVHNATYLQILLLWAVDIDLAAICHYTLMQQPSSARPDSGTFTEPVVTSIDRNRLFKALPPTPVLMELIHKVRWPSPVPAYCHSDSNFATQWIHSASVPICVRIVDTSHTRRVLASPLRCLLHVSNNNGFPKCYFSGEHTDLLIKKTTTVWT